MVINMYFISITIANIIWILYSMLEGLREGFFEYYKYKSKREITFNTKVIFNTQRILVLLSTGIVLFYTIGWLSILFTIANFFIFRYFHKIILNQTIKKLNQKVSTKETKEEELILDILDGKKTPMIILGVTMQVFIYLFMM